jgi:hypothetical protein
MRWLGLAAISAPFPCRIESAGSPMAAGPSAKSIALKPEKSDGRAQNACRQGKCGKIEALWICARIHLPRNLGAGIFGGWKSLNTGALLAASFRGIFPNEYSEALMDAAVAKQPKPKLSFELDAQLASAIGETARMEGRSISSTIRQLVMRGLAADDDGHVYFFDRDGVLRQGIRERVAIEPAEAPVEGARRSLKAKRGKAPAPPTVEPVVAIPDPALAVVDQPADEEPTPPTPFDPNWEPDDRVFGAALRFGLLTFSAARLFAEFKADALASQRVERNWLAAWQRYVAELAAAHKGAR